MMNDEITLYRPIPKIAKSGVYSEKFDKVGVDVFAYM